MHQAQFGHDLKLSQLICENNNFGKLLCCEKNCQNCALTCMVESCSCNSVSNQHQECSFVNANSIIQKVLKKKRVLTKQVEQGLQAVLHAYQSIIDELSMDKHKFTVWKQGYGLSYQQAALVNAIRDNNRTELIGDLVYKVKIGLYENVGEVKEWFNEAQFAQSWKYGSRVFNKMRKQLSELYQSSLKPLQMLSLKMDFSLINAANYKLNEQTNVIQKISGGSDWHTIVGLSPLPTKNKIVFDIIIVKTQSRNMMIGIVTETGRTMKTVYNSTQALCYYINNGYLYYGGTSRQLGTQVQGGCRMTIEIDRLSKQIKFYSNGTILGTVTLTERFLNEKMYVVVEGYDIGDSFRIEREAL